MVNRQDKKKNMDQNTGAYTNLHVFTPFDRGVKTEFHKDG